MAAKLIFARGRALESYVDSKKKWEAGLKTASNGMIIFSSMRKYLNTFESESGLILNDEFITREHDFIKRMIRYWCVKMGETLSPRYCDLEYVRKKASSIEAAYFVANVSNFECKRLGKWEAGTRIFGGQLSVTLSFNVKKKLIRMEMYKNENGKGEVCHDQVFSIDTDYGLKMDLLKKELIWKNVSLGNNEFSLWKIGMEDKIELESCYHGLNSFVHGNGIPDEVNEAGACLFNEKDSKGTQDDLPPFLLAFSQLFGHLHLFDKIMLPSKLKQYGITFLHSIFLTMNHGITKTKQGSDFWNRTYKYLFNYYQNDLIHYLSSIVNKPMEKKLKKKRNKLCEYYDSTQGKIVKELIGEEIMFLSKLIQSMNTSQFYLKKFVHRFVGAYTLNDKCAMNELFNIGIGRIESKKKWQDIVGSCEAGDLLELCCRNGELWDYVDSNTLLSKARDLLVQTMKQFTQKEMTLDEKEMETIGKDFGPFIQMAVEKGYGKCVAALQDRLRQCNADNNSFVVGVLCILLLFKQYKEEKEFKAFVVSLCEEVYNGSVNALVSIYILSKVDQYCLLMVNEHDAVLCLIRKIRQKLVCQERRYDDDNDDNCEKSNGDWDDA